MQENTVLATLLQQNPHLRVLDLAGNSCLPDRLLHAAVLAASCSKLSTLDLSGCELVRPGGYVPDAFPSLVRLDISGTATADADMQALTEGLPWLQHLALRGCRRVSWATIGPCSLDIRWQLCTVAFKPPVCCLPLLPGLPQCKRVRV